MNSEQNHFLDYIGTHDKLDYPSEVPFDSKDYVIDVDNMLLEIWERIGFHGYMSGLWWLTPPDLLNPSIISSSTNFSEGYIIGRTAFGDLFLCTQKNKVSVINMRIREVILMEEDLQFFFNVLLLNEDFLDDMLDRQLFMEAQNKLGLIDHEQCYGFFPPIKLGGDSVVENIEKVKLREHLVLLNQI